MITTRVCAAGTNTDSEIYSRISHLLIRTYTYALTHARAPTESCSKLNIKLSYNNERQEGRKSTCWICQVNKQKVCIITIVTDLDISGNRFFPPCLQLCCLFYNLTIDIQLLIRTHLLPEAITRAQCLKQDNDQRLGRVKRKKKQQADDWCQSIKCSACCDPWWIGLRTEKIWWRLWAV